jgi:hypothetical protein
VTGLLSAANGAEIAPSRVLELKKAEESFVFENVKGVFCACVVKLSLHNGKATQYLLTDIIILTKRPGLAIFVIFIVLVVPCSPS